MSFDKNVQTKIDRRDFARGAWGVESGFAGPVGSFGLFVALTGRLLSKAA